MSRIGKRAIMIPDGVTVTASGQKITVKGKLGELSFTHNEVIKVDIKDKEINITNTNTNKRNIKHSSSLHGTTNAIINNMIIGVTEGYKKDLEIVGVGYRVKQQGKNLEFSLGFSHPVKYTVPDCVEVKVEKPTKFTVSGIDKERVGSVAAVIRDFKKPEPYGGKGIRYVGEHIIRKAGKQGQ